jgi:hypothetical protein
MKKLVIEVNGVKYKCCDENDEVAEAVGVNYSKKEIVLLAFRNFVEIMGIDMF